MTFLTLSAELGIIATAAALLIIAGEFDLSVGSMIGFAGIVIGLDRALSRAAALGRRSAAAFAVAILVGYLNGLIVVKTRLPSFIVTLASLFILRGLSIGITRARHRPHADPLHPRRRARPGDGRALQRPRPHRPLPLDGRRRAGSPRAATASRSSPGIPMSIVWWLGHHGGRRLGADPDPLRQLDLRHRRRRRRRRAMSACRSTRVKISLFICTACAATLLATIQVMEAGSADTLRGTAQGVRGDHRRGHRRRAADRRLRHGLSALLFGALIFGLVQMGIFYTGIDTDWFKVFLGSSS